MPELPEVETVMRGLEPVLVNSEILSVDQRRANLRIPFPDKLPQKLQGRVFKNLYRRAKYIICVLDNGQALVVHLGMSGRISIVNDAGYEVQKHDHLIIELKDNTKIIYNDPRRFGMVFLVEEDLIHEHKAFAALGPEPLGNHFSGKILTECLKGKKTSIKQALLDQRIVVGVGNIYACEALFMAGINPQELAGDIKGKKADKLVECIRDVLTRAIEAGGSTLKDFAHADGELGYFQHNFSVYDREKHACKGCNCDINKTGGVQRVVQSGRSTFYCPKKQK